MIRHAIRELREHWDEPYWWHHRFWERVGGYILHPTGPLAIDCDWDVLVVLDGCRFDTFLKTIGDYPTLRGRTRKHWSHGSCSDEWIRANFADRDCSDLAVVTANPYYETELSPTHFGAIDHVWRDDRWDEDLGTVPAQAVADAARRMAAEQPYKRLVVHFMQPHYPFVSGALGGGGRGLRARAAADGGERSKAPVWANALEGRISWDQARAGYRDNLEYVLDVVADLVPAFDGRVVLTADHGNGFGERYWGLPIAGHPPSVPHWTLREVPWHVVGERHRIPTAADFR